MEGGGSWKEGGREAGVGGQVLVAWEGGKETYRLVLHGGAGDAPVKLIVILKTSIDQPLHGYLLLEQQEAIACRHTHCIGYGIEPRLDRPQ